MSDKKLPAMPQVFISSTLDSCLAKQHFSEQLQFTSNLFQKQTVQLLNYFAKHHGCIHEAAIMHGILSAFVTMFQSILEPTDDEAIKVMRLAAFEKMKESLMVMAPEVMSNMVKFYDEIINITLRDQEPKDKDEPHTSITLDANANYPATPAPATTAPKPAPAKPSIPKQWLN